MAIKSISVVAAAAAIGASTGRAQTLMPQSTKPAVQGTSLVDSLADKTIVWTFDDGPMAGVKIAHDFHRDGSVTWRMIDGEHRGASKREKSYAAIKVNEKTWAISYLAASGHTLTVVLNLDDGRMIGFGSNEKSWIVVHGRFDVPK